MVFAEFLELATEYHQRAASLDEKENYRLTLSKLLKRVFHMEILGTSANTVEAAKSAVRALIEVGSHAEKVRAIVDGPNLTETQAFKDLQSSGAQYQTAEEHFRKAAMSEVRAHLQLK